MQLTTSAKITDPKLVLALDANGELYGEIIRRLYVDLFVKKIHINDLKTKYIFKYKITARQFNGIAYDIKGKVKSVIELKKLEKAAKIAAIKNTEAKIKKAEAKLKSKSETIRPNFIKKNKTLEEVQDLCRINSEIRKLKFEIFNRKRKLASLKLKLIDTEAQIVQPSICFGSKALFKKQFNTTDKLGKGEFKTHEAWKNEWQFRRSNSMFFIGSNDETSGNQTCQLSKEVVYGMSVTNLKIRLPDCLLAFADNKKACTISSPIDFKYLKEELLEAVLGYEALMFNIKTNKNEIKHVKSAVTYRFSKNKVDGDWYCHATFNYTEAKIITREQCGRIGIDFNTNHLAVTLISYDGNLVDSFKVPFNFTKRTSDQINAELSNCIQRVINYNLKLETPVPIVVENLDFTRKKNYLKTDSSVRTKKYNRMLSSLTYSKFFQLIESKCKKNGIELFKVNPACTSIIGKFKFSDGYGISAHQAAAMVIARRSLFEVKKFSHTNTNLALSNKNKAINKNNKLKNLGEAFKTKTNQNNFSLPVRNREKHVWSDWIALNRVTKGDLRNLPGWPSLRDLVGSSGQGPDCPVDPLLASTETILTSKVKS